MTIEARPFGVCIATYDDFDGLYFTVEAIRQYHLPIHDRMSLTVVDNNPAGIAGQEVAKYLAGVREFPCQYLPATEAVGTSYPRDLAIRSCKADTFLCLDSHVLLPHGVLWRVANFLEGVRTGVSKKYTVKDLFHGPLTEGLNGHVSTHFEPVWRGEMWGIWGTDARGKDTANESFEIWGSGLGAFAGVTAEWPGFMAGAKGFGGEEGYIHEKVRKRGGKVWCLPFFRWVHRFPRPAGVPYPLTRYHKVRNYVLGHSELGLSLEPIREHFVASGLLPEAQWEEILAGKDEPTQQKDCGCKAGQVDPATAQMFASPDAAILTAEQGPRRELVAALNKLIDRGVSRVVIAGVGDGTIAVPAITSAHTTMVVMADSNPAATLMPLLAAGRGQPMTATQADATMIELPENDLTVIGIPYPTPMLAALLEKLTPRASRFLAIAGTSGPTQLVVMDAVRPWLRKHPEFSVIEHVEADTGLLILSKIDSDKPAVVPGKLRQAATLAMAVGSWFSRGLKTVDAETMRIRLEICDMCPARADGRCTLCGCYLEEPPVPGLAPKAALFDSECPAGKWPSLK